MKWLITGTRHGRSGISLELEQCVEQYGKPDQIVSGGARGVDFQAEIWADIKEIPLKVFLADWKQYGASAGPIRNKQMIDYCDSEKDLVIAFPDSVTSRGTRQCMGLARKSGFKVIEF